MQLSVRCEPALSLPSSYGKILMQPHGSICYCVSDGLVESRYEYELHG
jgi:hypothetical protein